MNKFEFVVVSGARAKQLQAGCTPRVERDSAKPARLAMKEVKQGKVEKQETGDRKQETGNRKQGTEGRR